MFCKFGLMPESMKSTQGRPDGPLQQKSGPYQGGNKNFKQGGQYQNQNNNNRGGGYQGNKPYTANNYFDAYEEEDEVPDWNDFDPEKETGNFFGREIPEEIKLRENLEAQKQRWGGQAARSNIIDDNDEFDAMFEEAMPT